MNERIAITLFARLFDAVSAESAGLGHVFALRRTIVTRRPVLRAAQGLPIIRALVAFFHIQQNMVVAANILFARGQARSKIRILVSIIALFARVDYAIAATVRDLTFGPLWFVRTFIRALAHMFSVIRTTDAINAIHRIFNFGAALIIADTVNALTQSHALLASPASLIRLTDCIICRVGRSEKFAFLKRGGLRIRQTDLGIGCALVHFHSFAGIVKNISAAFGLGAKAAIRLFFAEFIFIVRTNRTGRGKYLTIALLLRRIRFAVAAIRSLAAATIATSILVAQWRIRAITINQIPAPRAIAGFRIAAPVAFLARVEFAVAAILVITRTSFVAMPISPV